MARLADHIVRATFGQAQIYKMEIWISNLLYIEQNVRICFEADRLLFHSIVEQHASSPWFRPSSNWCKFELSNVAHLYLNQNVRCSPIHHAAPTRTLSRTYRLGGASSGEVESIRPRVRTRFILINALTIDYLRIDIL